jgi:uncharacterized protein (TIGR02466 family)
MNNYNLLPIFPVGILTCDLGRDLSNKELIVLHNLPVVNNTSNFSSQENYLLDMQELSSLKESLTAAVNTYMRDVVSADDNVSAYITQSWANYTTQNEHHHEHAHPNSFLSGVFYVNADESTDNITFFKGGYKQIKLNPKEFNLFNADSWYIPVKTGQIVLFPSSLRHMVETKHTTHTRVSIAFNTFLKGTLGSKKDTEELILT